MPRLTNDDYYVRYQFLRWVWENHDGFYSYLSSGDQQAVHDYYQPSKNLTTEELIAHRREITKQQPSLPNVASKAGHRLFRMVKAARVAAQERPVRQAQPVTSRDRHVRVRAVLRPEPDLKQLSRALVALAIHQAREIQAQQAASKIDQKPNS